MEQLEDLSRIIRQKDNDIEDLKQKIMDLEGQNRQIHKQMQQVKEEAAAQSANKGMDMLMNSSMKDKMVGDPRFNKLLAGK
mmetsp:Transcript_11441/g.19348  ORF Transcript_11441/g.19348 Transcript_11441/m.19348 type:complete len:81 (-) Transcript_11441:87-329(-)